MIGSPPPCGRSDPTALGRDGRQAAVGIAEDEDGIRPDTGNDLVCARDGEPAGCCRGGRGNLEEVIGLTDPQVVEKYLAQLVIVVLTGMDERVLAELVQHRNYPAQADDFWPGADDGHYLHWWFSSLGVSPRRIPHSSYGVRSAARLLTKVGQSGAT